MLHRRYKNDTIEPWQRAILENGQPAVKRSSILLSHIKMYWKLYCD